MKRRLEFMGARCVVQELRYEQGNRLALRLVAEDTGELYATISINIPSIELADDEVVVKDYGENRGILTLLVRAGILEPTPRVVQTGWELSRVCRYLPLS